MREFAVAMVLSALVIGGALLLPYSVDTAPLPQTVAVQQAVPPTPAVQQAAPQAVPPPAPTTPTAPAPQRHAQTVAQPVAAGGGDPQQGRQVYRKCQACHSLEPGKNGVGPTLAAIVGKKAASDPSFGYSPALRASGLTWDVPTLDQY